MRFTRGFTLIELMVTIAVLAIVTSIAVPSFSGMLRENRALALTNELQSALQLARSEAVKRRSNVVICRRNTAGTECADGTDWANGWVVLAGSNVIKSWDTTGGLVVVGPNTGLTFKANGTITAGSTTNLTVNASGCSGTQKRQIAVTIIGTATTTKVSCS